MSKDISFTKYPRTTTQQIPYKPSVTANHYHLLWQDNFDSGKFDKSKWLPEIGYVRNGELQRYTENSPLNVFTEDNKLHIRMNYIDCSPELTMNSWVNDHYDDPTVVTSACITTQHVGEGSTDRRVNRGEIKNSRIVVRASACSIPGVWPAIWFLGSKYNQPHGRRWPECGEIDLLESLGGVKRAAYQTVHVTGDNTSKTHRSHRSKSHTEYTEIEDKMVTYTLDMRDDRIDMWVDDKHCFEYCKSKLYAKTLNAPAIDTGKWFWPFSEGIYLLINLALGGSWGGKDGASIGMLPKDFVIEYVRVYDLLQEK